jgi:hypothetical protein
VAERCARCRRDALAAAESIDPVGGARRLIGPVVLANCAPSCATR